jgi:putative intracellular protease/amidase
MKGGKTMKRVTTFVAIVLCMAVCLSLIPTKIFAESRPKVLLIIREGYSHNLSYVLENEVWPMRMMLGRAGFKVETATAAGYPIVSSSRDLEPDLKLMNAKAADYVGVIIPCMAVGSIPGPPMAPEAVAIVKQAAAEGKPVAAQLGGVTILAKAGILKGKKYAFASDPLKTTPRRKIIDPNFTGAVYSGRGVVQDGKIITSGMCALGAKAYGFPDGTTKLTQTFIAELKKK